ncbi:MAG: hypothetical protein J0L80_04945 [Chitinophagales bacterium]|nr:hypothetical protein [Chitinophagales bacterium]
MIEIIFYVADQQMSKQFYQFVLNAKPILDVPGMTEFLLSKDCKLGLMPETGIAKILGDKVPHPSTGNGIPRYELYLYTTGTADYYQRLVIAGAKEISLSKKGLGEIVPVISVIETAYVIAVAEKISP